MKIICNKCYVNNLTIHDYDGKMYADPCSCTEIDQDDREEKVYEGGYSDGYDEGFAYGYEQGLKTGGEHE